MHADPALADEEDDAVRISAASLVLRLRGLGISDRRVLNAIETVPRTLFVPEPWRDFAYADRPLPIECGQTISAPSLVGLLTAALDVSERHSVLEIGTGSGYQAAVLARLARRVTTMDRFRSLVRAAERRWLALGLRNISGIAGDGASGWPAQAPFDRILVTAAVAEPPVRLIRQLSDTGILIAPIGPEAAGQRVTLFQRIGTRVETRDLGPGQFLSLVSGLAQSL